MKSYYVYFSQINQERIEVEARGPREALRRATREWKATYKEPSHIGTEEIRRGDK